MAPWLPSLRTSLVPTDPDGDKAREKIAVIFRKLIEVALSSLALSNTLEQNIWPVIRQDELYKDLFLEEIFKAALSFGVDDERIEALGSILASLGTVTIRGKLLSRLRKALNRSSLRPTRHLPENTVWSEICVLLRLCLSTSFDCEAQAHLYLPEIFHLVTMLANTGSPTVRLTVHRLLVNTVHSMCTKFVLDDAKCTRLRALLASLSETRSDLLFNIPIRDGPAMSPSQEGGTSILLATENLAALLSEITVVAAPSVDLSNSWRSRWMSLVASTAFQSNPAIQPRAFTVMGCLAREDVDDDLLYQVLVALRNSIGRFMEDSDSEMLISIVASLTRMINKLPLASRYGHQLFWLALSLVRLVPISLFNTTALFLNAVLNNINTSGDFNGGRMIMTLLQGRVPIEDAASQLDENYGIHFTPENFHFAICASLVKGLTDAATKPTAVYVLSSFLEITSSSMPDGVKFPEDTSCVPYIGLLMSRAMTQEEIKDSLWLGKMTSAGHAEVKDVLGMLSLASIKDKELLLNAAIALVDFRYLEETVQTRDLTWLNRIAQKRPAVILHL